jgi:hypothetical protein
MSKIGLSRSGRPVRQTLLTRTAAVEKPPNQMKSNDMFFADNSSACWKIRTSADARYLSFETSYRQAVEKYSIQPPTLQRKARSVNILLAI